jgi:sulfite exporter TauE/SafE
LEAGYLLAFTTGILGGFGHCIGMCGPLVTSYTLATPISGIPPSVFNRLTPHLFYNLGRITTYTLIGGIMGFSGSFVNVAGRIAGIQNVVAILAGLMMIFMGLSIIGLRRDTVWIERHNLLVLRAAQRVLGLSSPSRYYPLGLILGLLPCGLSYTVFIAAAGTGGPFPGMLTGFLFGLGTLPALLLFGAVMSSLGATLRKRIYRAGGVLVIVMGIYFLYRGVKLYAHL